MTEQTTTYALMQHVASGEVYAIRTDATGITGVCGPLAENERDAPGTHYPYDDQPEDVEWANEIDNGMHQGQSWRFVRPL